MKIICMYASVVYGNHRVSKVHFVFLCYVPWEEIIDTKRYNSLDNYTFFRKFHLTNIDCHSCHIQESMYTRAAHYRLPLTLLIILVNCPGFF